MTIRKSLAAGIAALSLAFLVSSAPVQAATQVLCAPDISGGIQGPRRVVNFSSTAATQPSYQLNAFGCAVINQADIGFFLSQGYTPGSSEGTILFTTGVATGTTDFTIGSLPPNTYITEIIFSNSVAAAVTGGISIGTTANGTDVVAATAVGSTALTFTPNASILKQPFSLTASTPLHAAAVTAWNSANVTITVKYANF